ncbi:MAG TPA: sigma-70 family RNA polymerase sigma factor [Chryseolinea sp.]|nr:sigma-70 family RNA polymerase sigma factor [Chryseolinea sp.]
MNTSETLIWASTQDRLKSFVFKQTRDKAITDDIVQDVFLKVHAKVGQLKESDKLVSWIFQVTRHTITDYFRKKAKILNAHDIDWESENVSLNDCVSSCLSDMLATLPDKYRQALELTELKNISQLELANTLGISYSGAKSRVQRARQMLKEKMDEAYQIKLDLYGNVVVCENKTPCSCPQRDEFGI